jgi:hypothetical protein
MTLAAATHAETYQEDAVKATLRGEDAESGGTDQQDVVLTFEDFAAALSNSGLEGLQAAEREMAAVAAERLRELKRLGRAGQRSAIVMLGPKGGVLVADRAASKVSRLALVVPGETAPVGATPTVCAETQLQRGLWLPLGSLRAPPSCGDGSTLRSRAAFYLDIGEGFTDNQVNHEL